MFSNKESIPHLDFDLFSKDKTSLAKDTINAFHDYGFCVFFNHTIDKDLIANCLSMYQEFFNYPDNVKESFIVPDIGGARGFTKFKTETAKNYDSPDLKEFWHVGRAKLDYPKYIWIKE
jgi:isopenicillin N synthase-like dioxygenase